jgi:hypothetical protein
MPNDLLVLICIILFTIGACLLAVILWRTWLEYRRGKKFLASSLPPVTEYKEFNKMFETRRNHD